jgi:hypothetical protein
VNVVCLSGRLGQPTDSGIPLREGWSSRVLRVPRQGLDGEEDAGVFGVPLLLPRDVAFDVARHGTGAWVSVVGTLTVDVEYSAGTPTARSAIVVRSVEAAPEPAGAQQ